uniref:Uncharacterized protein n=1 Tax=Glossina brevipalpis TaxID=37001 RepID=A0A1A9WBF2_9MUSC
MLTNIVRIVKRKQKSGGPVKISIVGGGQRGSKVWRRERIEMTHDPDLDDCAFLSEEEEVEETEEKEEEMKVEEGEEEKGEEE